MNRSGTAAEVRAGSSSNSADARNRILGTALMMTGSMLFASKGLFAKALYARGVGYEMVVIVRAFLSLPMFWLFAWSRGELTGRPIAWRPVAIAAAAGAACYYIGAMTDFFALTLIDASVERVLMFSYPALVVVLTAFATRTRPAAATLIAATMTYLGIFFVMGGFDLALLRANFIGSLGVFVAAFTYAFYFMAGERQSRRIGSTLFTLSAMSAATAAVGVHALVRAPVLELPPPSLVTWLLLVGTAVLCMFVPALLQAEGVRRIGAVRGSVVSTVGPPTTIVLAWLLFDEAMTAWQFLGVALIVAGILYVDLARVSGRTPRDPD